MPAKAGHLTVGACLIGSGLLLVWSSWDEFTCRAGETTSSGPCGVGIDVAGAVFLFGLFLLVSGAIVLARGLRRPIDPEGSGGWRAGQGIAVMVCSAAFALMIPRYECPEGTSLSAVFRFCVSTERVFRAPSPGLGWKFAALAVGVAVGLVIILWRSMPWPLATVLVVGAFAAATVLMAGRTTGLPGTQRDFDVVPAVLTAPVRSAADP